ncbi:MAG: hypothetical protein EU518_00225 [Promethearchaeota archaeon]|nr:MAG: hypothetical protein EU518_00225 [Candidatus Lokiarchaeota archaeon]
MKVRKKSYITLFIISILLVLNAFSIFVIFNLDLILDLGHYQIEENDKIEYGGNSIEFNYLVDFDYNIQIDRYESVLNINYISDQTEQIIGISKIDCTIQINELLILSNETTFGSPKESYHYEFYAELNENDNFNAYGSVTLLVNVSGVAEEIQSEFDIIYIMGVSTWQYYYEFHIGRIWLEILLITCFFILIFFLIRNVNEINKQRKITKEEKFRNDAFLEYIRWKSQTEEEEERY